MERKVKGGRRKVVWVGGGRGQEGAVEGWCGWGGQRKAPGAGVQGRCHEDQCGGAWDKSRHTCIYGEVGVCRV